MSAARNARRADPWKSTDDFLAPVEPSRWSFPISGCGGVAFHDSARNRRGKPRQKLPGIVFAFFVLVRDPIFCPYRDPRWGSLADKVASGVDNDIDEEGVNPTFLNA